MKKSILAMTAMVAMVFFGCDEPAYINEPGDNSFNDSIPPVVVDQLPTPDPDGVEVPDSCLNVYEARAICDSIGVDNTTTEKYYVKGWVRRFDDKHWSGIEQYGNGTFYIAATNDGKSDAKLFEAYQIMGKDGKKLYANEVAIGDFVVIYSQLTNFKGTAETVGKGAAQIYSSSNPNFDPQMDPSKITPDPEGADVPEGTLSVYEAIHIGDSIGSGKTTDDEYYVKGWVCRLDSKHKSGVESYGNGTFYLAATNDGTTDMFTFEAYQVYGKDKQKLTDPDQVQVGDFVVLRGKLTNYNGTSETVGKGAAYIYYSTNPLW